MRILPSVTTSARVVTYFLTIEVELAFSGLKLSDADMKIADWMSFVF